ncbi:hypothetical protein PM082_015315 [Marasmius tenuissimus]|nr:hypothetical protein PM082_015315 [Marasmius tenuissimus]
MPPNRARKTALAPPYCGEARKDDLGVHLEYWDTELDTWTRAPHFIPAESRQWVIKPKQPKERLERSVAFVEFKPNTRFRVVVDGYRLPDRDLVMYVHIDATPTCATRSLIKAPRPPRHSTSKRMTKTKRRFVSERSKISLTPLAQPPKAILGRSGLDL